MGFGVPYNGSGTAPRMESKDKRDMIFLHMVDKQGK